MNYTIREIRETEYHVLEDFLYEAIFVPKGMVPPPRAIIKTRELQVYLTDFGRQPGDIGLVAEVRPKIVGAAWARIMDDYGHIDSNTPSLAISLHKEYRSLGIGTAMMEKMLQALRKRGWLQASLAVQKENYVVKMYRKAGFEVVCERDTEYIMACSL